MQLCSSVYAVSHMLLITMQRSCVPTAEPKFCEGSIHFSMATFLIYQAFVVFHQMRLCTQTAGMYYDTI